MSKRSGRETEPGFKRHAPEGGMLSLLVASCLLIASGQLQSQEAGQISVVAMGEESYSGVLRVRLATNAAEYTGETQAYLEKAVPMNGESATVPLQDVEPGQYAVAVYLDENEDGELNTNLFGAPKEPIGFSRNPRIGMSRPTFSETVFEYTGGDLDVDIELKD